MTTAISQLPPNISELLLRMRRTGAGGKKFAEELLALLETDPGLKKQIPAKDLAMLMAWKHARNDYAGTMQLHYLMNYADEQPRVPAGSEHGGEFTAGHGGTTLSLKGTSDQHHDLMGKLLEASKETHAPKKPKHPAIEQMREVMRKKPAERVAQVEAKRQQFREQSPALAKGSMPGFPDFVTEKWHADEMAKLPEYKAWRAAFEQHHGLGSVEKKMHNRKQFEAAYNALKSAWQRQLPHIKPPVQHAPQSLGGLFGQQQMSFAEMMYESWQDSYVSPTVFIHDDIRCYETDLIHGGKGDAKKAGDFDSTALAKGKKVEREHTDNPKIAQEIAKDHLTEDANYYDKLARMEHPKQGSQLAALFAEIAEFFKPQPTTVHLHPQITVQASTIPAPVVHVKPQINVEQAQVTVRPEIKVDAPQITVQPAKVVMPAHKGVHTEILYDKSGRVTGKIERPTED